MLIEVSVCVLNCLERLFHQCLNLGSILRVESDAAKFLAIDRYDEVL